MLNMIWAPLMYACVLIDKKYSSMFFRGLIHKSQAFCILVELLSVRTAL